MKHKLTDTDISHYNSFKIFEDIYGQTNKSQRFDELDIPIEPPPATAWNWFLGSLIILVIALAVHPLLSYSLKTPHPLIIIAENSMQPSLVHGDLVLSTGIINTSQIKLNDIVVFKTNDIPTKISVQRVIAVSNNALVVRGDAAGAPTIEISAQQVISKIVENNKQPFRIPLVGKLSSLLARM